LPRDLKLIPFFVIGVYQVVVAHILVAAAKGMALVIRKDFVYARSRSNLRRNHLPGLITDLFLVRWVLQLAIPSVAATSLCT
jgi:hypothetical protein